MSRKLFDDLSLVLFANFHADVGDPDGPLPNS
jgi:hypothetical protein